LKPDYHTWVREVSDLTGGAPASISELSRAYERGLTPKEASQLRLLSSENRRVHWTIQVFEGLFALFLIVVVVSIPLYFWQRITLGSSEFGRQASTFFEYFFSVDSLLRNLFFLAVLFVVIRAMRSRPEKFGLLVD